MTISTRERIGLVLLIVIIVILFLGWKVHGRGYLFAGTVTVTVDPQLKPHVQTVAGFDQQPARPVAAMSDGVGNTIAFVENELIFVTDDDAALAAFVKRVGGTVVRHLAPKQYGIASASQHLVRIDPNRANTSQLVDDLEALNTGRTGKLIVSSQAGRGLLATASREAASGKSVGINFVLKLSGFADKNVTEGMAPPSTVPQAEMYSNRNPTTWSYFVRGPGTQNIGVGDAWRALDQVGRLSNKVSAAVLDGGFLQSDDNPANWTHHTNSVWAMDPNRANENDCTNGSKCEWHGTNVVGALMGVANNGFGAAGPAGPVANAVTIRMSGDMFNYLGGFVIAFGSGARVVNMSFGGSVPALVTFAVVPLDAFTNAMRVAGVLIVAAAGNDGNDVDAEDCAWPFDWPCWERAWYVPCENAGVMCVGALKVNSDQKRPTSNYGRNAVNIFGPGDVWVGPDLQYQAVHSFSATSAASPFVAGVAALLFAANPKLNAAAVEKIMMDTANPSSDGQVQRYVNAYAAVIRALGGTPPDITIAATVTESFGSCRARYQFSATVSDPDDGPPTVSWISDVDGAIGAGTSFTRELSPGTHHITANAVDRIGLSTRSNEVELRVGNTSGPATPTISIISLTNHESFAANQKVTLEAGGLDPNKALGGLVAANVRWESLKDGELGWGQRLFRTLSPGAHFINVHYTGICGGTADDQRLIQVTAAVVDGPPNMLITTPSGNDLLIRTDQSGQACLRVAGFGFDEEDKDFATLDGWETNRKDLQFKLLSFEQNTTVCLKISPNLAPTVHEIRLKGKDRTGHVAVSAPLRVTVLPGVH